MKTSLFLPALLLLAGATVTAQTQTNRPSTERIWKDLSRLPHALRDDLQSAAWWQTENAPVRLDSIVKFSNFNGGTLAPLNKIEFTYPSAGETVQSEYVNYGRWTLQKRTTLKLDAQKRITEVTEEEPDPNNGSMLPGARINFYRHGNSPTQCDSVVSSNWDDQWQQWIPATKLISFFNAQGQEIASETYRYDEGFQTVGIREESEFNQIGDATSTRQFVARDNQWVLLGKVQSTFDDRHHETFRQEEIAEADNRFSAVRKVLRRYDAAGNLEFEQRFKWNGKKGIWAPLKTITAGTDDKHRSGWMVTETDSMSSNDYKTKVEKIKRRDGAMLDREVYSSYRPKSEKWQVMSESRYFYAQ